MSKFPLQYEEINNEEYHQFSEKSEPDGNFFYHVSDNQCILLMIKDKVTESIAFLSMTDLEMFTSGKLDLTDERYLEYKNLNAESLNDYERTINSSFREFILLNYPLAFNEYIKTK